MATVTARAHEPSDAPGHAATRTAHLLAELSPNTDLIWLVERVTQTKLPWVVIPDTALTAWEARRSGRLGEGVGLARCPRCLHRADLTLAGLEC